MVIALLTDFGIRDHFVASMKGAILSINPSAQIVDITHEVAAQDIREAAFTLAACFSDFPAGTIFVVVVDPGVGSERRGIAVSSGGYYFVGPDNGALSFAVADDAKIVDLTKPDYFAERVSSTFHGRDIFAPVAAHLSNGVWLEEFGLAVNDPVIFEFPKPQMTSDGETIAEILHIDHFGNLITNLTEGDLPERFEIHVGGQLIGKHCRFYGESEPGELISIIGSTGFLEIAANQGSARHLLNAKVGQHLRLTREN